MRRRKHDKNKQFVQLRLWCSGYPAGDSLMSPKIQSQKTACANVNATLQTHQMTMGTKNDSNDRNKDATAKKKLGPRKRKGAEELICKKLPKSHS